MSKLVAWKTPFATAKWPSVWISTERELCTARVFVDADDLWQVTFGYIAGIKICDESYDKNTRFHIERDEQELCSYFWEGSLWLADFETEYVRDIERGELKHYVLLGGDYNVELLALGEPHIAPARVGGV